MKEQDLFLFGKIWALKDMYERVMIDLNSMKVDSTAALSVYAGYYCLGRSYYYLKTLLSKWEKLTISNFLLSFPTKL